MSDTIATLGRRIYQEKPLWKPHSQYYYKNAVHHGRRHDSVVRYILGVNLLLGLLAVYSVINPDMAIFYVAMAYMSVFMILGFFAYTPYNPNHEPF